MLAGTLLSQTLFGVTNDLTLPAGNGLIPAGGAACFTSTSFGAPTGPGIDCVSWGTFAAGGTFPTNAGAATGTPEDAIPDGNSIVRDISASCSTLHDSTDDTNQSQANFAAAPVPSPRNNGTAITEAACLLSVGNPGSSGSVTSSPAGINCPSDCAEFYAGQTVVLTATSSGLNSFNNWSVGCPMPGVPSTNQCTAQMNISRTITANFHPPRTLDVMLAGTGAGGVTSSPVGIDCGLDCDESYVHGTPVTLTAAHRRLDLQQLDQLPGDGPPFERVRHGDEHEPDDHRRPSTHQSARS